MLKNVSFFHPPEFLFSIIFKKIMQLEVVLGSGTVCSAFYSLVAGIFGMNIPYTWNDNHGYMFKWVCITKSPFAWYTRKYFSGLTQTGFVVAGLYRDGGNLCVLVSIHNVVRSVQRAYGILIGLERRF